MLPIILPLLLILNLAAFLTYGIDKARARRGAWRISKMVLLTLGIMGGFGAFAGMRLFHHKTRQTVFKLAAFIGIFINSVVFAWLLF
jgi:uncharacterized membrane protein YsdA (DUF1294 family)